jgi:hypothetical protein
VPTLLSAAHTHMASCFMIYQQLCMSVHNTVLYWQLMQSSNFSPEQLKSEIFATETEICCACGLCYCHMMNSPLLSMCWECVTAREELLQKHNAKPKQYVFTLVLFGRLPKWLKDSNTYTVTWSKISYFNGPCVSEDNW